LIGYLLVTMYEYHVRRQKDFRHEFGGGIESLNNRVSVSAVLGKFKYLKPCLTTLPSDKETLLVLR